jgi:hypothetical protein
VSGETYNQTPRKDEKSKMTERPEICLKRPGMRLYAAMPLLTAILTQASVDPAASTYGLEQAYG